MHLPLPPDESPKDNFAAGAFFQRRGGPPPPLPWTTFSPPRTATILRLKNVAGIIRSDDAHAKYSWYPL
jgi:hypothetical protein